MSKKKHPEHVNHERWLVSYADFITLLFAFFVVLFASGQSDKRKREELAKAMQVAFQYQGIFEQHSTTPPLTDEATNAPASVPSPLALPLPSTLESERVSKEIQKHIEENLEKELGLHPVDSAAALKDALKEKPGSLATAEKPGAEGKAATQEKPSAAGKPADDDKNGPENASKSAAKPEASHAAGGTAAVTVRTTVDGIVVSLREAGFFDSGSADLREASLPLVRAIAASLPHGPIRVEGHTDNIPIHTGQYATNWELSTARAAAITRMLLDLGAADPRQISAAGYAEFHPLASNATAEGRAQNRRVDIVLLRPPQ
jgi:chemotaxis protein MotB